MTQLKDTHVDGVLSAGVCEDVEAELSKLNSKKVEKTISETTSQYGNLTSDILASEYYIESVKSASGLICIPYTTTDGYWAINVRASGTFNAQPGVQVTATALCYKIS